MYEKKEKGMEIVGKMWKIKSFLGYSSNKKFQKLASF